MTHIEKDQFKQFEYSSFPIYLKNFTAIILDFTDCFTVLKKLKENI